MRESTVKLIHHGSWQQVPQLCYSIWLALINGSTTKNEQVARSVDCPSVGSSLPFPRNRHHSSYSSFPHCHLLLFKSLCPFHPSPTWLLLPLFNVRWGAMFSPLVLPKRLVVSVYKSSRMNCKKTATGLDHDCNQLELQLQLQQYQILISCSSTTFGIHCNCKKTGLDWFKPVIM